MLYFCLVFFGGVVISGGGKGFRYGNRVVMKVRTVLQGGRVIKGYKEENNLPLRPLIKTNQLRQLLVMK